MRAGLYPIVDLDALGARDPVRFTEQLLRAGALFALQLRAKHLHGRPFLQLARSLAVRCAEAHVPFVVNDRVDIAVLAGAPMVHVGQEDLSIEQVRAMAPSLLVGISTHNEAQFLSVLPSHPAYVAVGPVFATQSKANPDPVVGVELLGSLCARSSGIPVVAIGGITLDRAVQVHAAGVRAAAVIGALTVVPDEEVTACARAMHLALGGS